MPLFGKSHKSPPELVKTLQESLVAIANDKDGKKSGKAVEDISKVLATMKVMLYGAEGQEPQTEVTTQLAQDMYSKNMLLLLIQNLARIEFEVGYSSCLQSMLDLALIPKKFEHRVNFTVP